MPAESHFLLMWVTKRQTERERHRGVTLKAELITQCDWKERNMNGWTVLFCVGSGWKRARGGGEGWLLRCKWSPASTHSVWVLYTTETDSHQTVYSIERTHHVKEVSVLKFCGHKVRPMSHFLLVSLPVLTDLKQYLNWRQLVAALPQLTPPLSVIFFAHFRDSNMGGVKAVRGRCFRWSPI